MVLSYSGSVKGLREALRESRKAVMTLGKDNLIDIDVYKAVKRQFYKAQVKEGRQRHGGGSIA